MPRGSAATALCADRSRQRRRWGVRDLISQNSPSAAAGRGQGVLVVVLSCIPLGGAAGVDGAQHQQCHKSWGIRGRGLTCDPQAQSFLWKWHSALLGTALSKFSILFSGLGAPHWLGKQCWMCHCTGCLMCWAGSRWCRAQGNRAVLSGWQPPEHWGCQHGK